MNREIKFRAKGIEKNDKDRWYYGSYYRTDDTTYCFEQDYIAHPDNTKHYILFDETTDWCLPNRKLRADIDINTLGQYTGLKDKNGVEIYEGDIVKISYENTKHTYIAEIKYAENRMCFVFKTHYPIISHYSLDEIGEMHKVDIAEGMIALFSFEKIGNIYENPELLEVNYE